MATITTNERYVTLANEFASQKDLDATKGTLEDTQADLFDTTKTIAQLKEDLSQTEENLIQLDESMKFLSKIALIGAIAWSIALIIAVFVFAHAINDIDARLDKIESSQQQVITQISTGEAE